MPDEATREVLQRIHALEETVTTLAGVVQSLSSRGSGDEDGAESADPRHQEWKCSCCRTRLGYYDEAEDVLRIRFRDYFVRQKLGAGGWSEVICRRCGQENRVEYVPPS